MPVPEVVLIKYGFILKRKQKLTQNCPEFSRQMIRFVIFYWRSHSAYDSTNNYQSYLLLSVKIYLLYYKLTVMLRVREKKKRIICYSMDKISGSQVGVNALKLNDIKYATKERQSIHLKPKKKILTKQ